MADSPASPESDRPVVAAAVGAASESGLGQHARAAYEAKLWRSLADDRQALVQYAQQGLQTAKAVGVAAVQGYKEIRQQQQQRQQQRRPQSPHLDAS
jgi:hypothetical protein